MRICTCVMYMYPHAVYALLYMYICMYLGSVYVLVCCTCVYALYKVIISMCVQFDEQNLAKYSTLSKFSLSILTDFTCICGYTCTHMYMYTYTYMYTCICLMSLIIKNAFVHVSRVIILRMQV